MQNLEFITFGFVLEIIGAIILAKLSFNWKILRSGLSLPDHHKMREGLPDSYYQKEQLKILFGIILMGLGFACQIIGMVLNYMVKN